MTRPEVLAELERRLGPLDEKAKQAVEVALEIVQGGVTAASEPQWQGENPPFEEMAKLSLEERSRINDELIERNREWLERKCRELQARWLIVVDGAVMAYDRSTGHRLPTAELWGPIGERTGKFPLVFIHPLALAIEEVTPWHPTMTPHDFYPTLEVRVSNGGNAATVTADFDTGAGDVYVSADLLQQAGVITISPLGFVFPSSHLGRLYRYVAKTLSLALTADGVSRTQAQDVVCVLDWANSPFVTINPTRTALVGRDLCLRLQPTVALDFARHVTRLHW